MRSKILSFNFIIKLSNSIRYLRQLVCQIIFKDFDELYSEKIDCIHVFHQIYEMLLFFHIHEICR